MSKQTSRSTKKSLGLLSEREIDLWNSEAKRRSRITARDNNNKTLNLGKSSINNEEDFSIVFDTSLNQLREKTKSERSNSSSLSNCMKYLEVDLHRKKQMVDIAKTKYLKMMEVRNQSFVEKIHMQKERELESRRHMMSVTLQASRIRDQSRNSSITTKIWREKNNEAANSIKEKRLRNQKMIAERQQMEVEQKRRMVERQHNLSQMSRQKLQQISNERIAEGKQNHSRRMLQEYARAQVQRRKNVNLQGVFKQKVEKIQEDSGKYKRQLDEYEKKLGWRYNKRNANSSVKKTTFYMTN